MNQVDAFKESIAEFDRRVRAVPADAWENPTPCSEWDVRALVNHVTVEALWTPHLLDGATIADVGDRYDGDVLGADAVAAWTEAMNSELDALTGPDVLERTVNVSWGQISGTDYVSQLTTDHLVHAWDLAKATTGETELPMELVQVVYDAAAPIEDMLKSTGAFGEKIEAPSDAPLQTRMLAVFGRTP